MPSIRKCNRRRKKAQRRARNRFTGWNLVISLGKGRRKRLKAHRLELLSISPPIIKTEHGIHNLRIPEPKKEYVLIAPLTVHYVSPDLQQWADLQDEYQRQMRQLMGIN